MKMSGRFFFAAVLPALLIASLAGIGSTIPDAEEAPEKTEYVCPPCGTDCHEEAFSAAGNCPVCGMVMVKKSKVTNESRNVAILVFDGVQIIDYTGPYEVFGQGPFNVYTVSETGETITTAMNMSVNPTYNFRNSPPADILVVPGGTVHRQYDSPEVISWVQNAAAGAENVLSVCNGAFILAKAGLLDGLTATTFYGLLEELQSFAPKVRVVRDRRFVDNGKIITSAGLSSGIDASLHLVSKLLGHGRAQKLALHLEYDWRPESDFARAALADRYLPEVHEPEGARMEMISTEGERDRWEARLLVQTDLSPADLRDHIHTEIRDRNRWARTGDPSAGSVDPARWTFKDESGELWQASTEIDPLPGESSAYLVTVKLRKAAMVGKAGN